MTQHSPLRNECIKHGLKFYYDMDECPYCVREHYEARFRAEVYQNAEERHRRYIEELRETISAQEKRIYELEQALKDAEK